MDLDLQNPNSLGHWQQQAREHSRAPVTQGLVERSLELCLGEHGQHRIERPAERALARTIDDALKRLVPDSDLAVPIEDAYALIEELDHVVVTLLALETIEVAEVRAIDEDERHHRREQQSPHPMFNRGDDHDRHDRRQDEIGKVPPNKPRP